MVASFRAGRNSLSFTTSASCLLIAEKSWVHSFDGVLLHHAIVRVPSFSCQLVPRVIPE